MQQYPSFQKFTNHVISGLTARLWPGLMPVTIGLLVLVRRSCRAQNEPTWLRMLKQTVQVFADCLDAEDAKRAVWHLWKRVGVYVMRGVIMLNRQ